MLLKKNVETKPPNLSANPVSFSPPLSLSKKTKKGEKKKREKKSVGTCKAWYKNEEILIKTPQKTHI
jgi:hypothetical protein